MSMWATVAVAFVTLLLLGPVSYQAELEVAGALGGRGRVAWLGGLLGLAFQLPDGPALTLAGHPVRRSSGRRKERAGPVRKAAPRRKSKRASTRRFDPRPFLRREVARAALALLLRLRAALHLTLEGDGVLAFPDPAATGWAAALLAAVPPERLGFPRVNLTCDFTAEVPSGAVQLQGWFLPLGLVGSLALAAVQPEGRLLWRTFRQARRKTK